MKKPVAFVLALACLATGCGLKRDPERSIAGKWELQEMAGWYEFDLRPAKDGPTTIAFRGHEFTYTNGDGPGEHSLSGTFSCDSVTTPNEIAFVFGGRTVAGCYSLSGDELRVCIGEDDAVPPKVLAGGPGERPALLVFRRVNSDEVQ